MVEIVEMVFTATPSKISITCSLSASSRHQRANGFSLHVAPIAMNLAGDRDHGVELGIGQGLTAADRPARRQRRRRSVLRDRSKKLLVWDNPVHSQVSVVARSKLQTKLTFQAPSGKNSALTFFAL